MLSWMSNRHTSSENGSGPVNGEDDLFHPDCSCSCTSEFNNAGNHRTPLQAPPALDFTPPNHPRCHHDWHAEVIDIELAYRRRDGRNTNAYLVKKYGSPLPSLTLTRSRGVVVNTGDGIQKKKLLLVLGLVATFHSKWGSVWTRFAKTFWKAWQ